MAVEHWVPSEVAVEAESAYDHAILMRRLGDDEELLTELRRILAQESAKHLVELVGAVVRLDVQSVARTAHCVRGMVTTFAAQRAGRVAAELERCGRSGCLVDAPDLVDRLAWELHALEVELRLNTTSMQEREMQ